jgi:alcohol dehydrogenase (cytochrome c)
MPLSARRAILIAALFASHHAAAQGLFNGENPRGNLAAGMTVYGQACVTCHGPRLEGSPFGPTLLGQAFMNKWRGKPAAELTTLMQNTMPPKGAGTSVVKPESFPDVLAFLVVANLQGPPAAGVMPTTTAPARAAVTEPPPANVAQRLARLTAVTDAMLASPPDGDWLMWRRTPDSAGFSPLKSIDRGNVQQLKQAWTLRLDPGSNEITPLVHEGVLYVYSGAVLQAVDAVTGKRLWKYTHASAAQLQTMSQRNGGQGPRLKSIAMYGHSLFLPTPDGHVVALDARTGKTLWDRAIHSHGERGSTVELSSAPLVARGVVIIGGALGLTNKGGSIIVGLDAATGKQLWRFHTIAQSGSPGGDTWNDAPADERFGGGIWTTGSYDATLDLVYFGVGNTYTTATLLQPRGDATSVTANDGLYTDSTVALRPATGELVWHHQHHRRDVWDQDWAFEQTLVTLGSGADARRAVVTGGKTGIFEAVDAATGKFLFAHDTGLTNLFLSVDPKTGVKQPNPALEPVAGKSMVLCPSSFGVRNWPATALNPAGTLFAPMLESCADFTYQPRSARETANGGTDIRFNPRPRPDSDGNFGRMMALDLATQSVKWTHRQRMPLAGSLLATAGGLVFMGDLERFFSAFDQDSGKMLWRTKLPAAAESTPISYAVDGKQYLAVVSGEASRLGSISRRLVAELDAPKSEITLVVFALK